MKSLLVVSIFISIYQPLYSQENRKGDFVLGLLAGPGFSNFANSEAPHKPNIYGSDVQPVLFFYPDLAQSPNYVNYRTSVFKDILSGVTAGMQLEYFFRNDLSLTSGVNYEPKGINLNYSNTANPYLSNGYTLNESLKIKIENGYLTIPVLLRKYLGKTKSFFVEGGVYTGHLLSSKITTTTEKTVSNETWIVSSYSDWTNGKDVKKENTNNFDFGISGGGGFVKEVFENWIFKTEVTLNVGLLKLDSKYNNEYSAIPTPSTTGYVFRVRSTNYYGLNSNAKNINLTCRLGVGYKISHREGK